MRVLDVYRAVRIIFSPGESMAYMPKKVPNIRRIINIMSNDILKVVHNIVFSRWGGGGGSCPLSPRCVRPGMFRIVIIFKA
jgi:hypothetical protein